MSGCGVPPSGAPVLKLTLVGNGEPLLRLEKRLSCAAAGLGLDLDLEIRKDLEAFVLAHGQMPAVLADGQVLFSGLPRTEDIEARLRQGLVPRERER